MIQYFRSPALVAALAIGALASLALHPEGASAQIPSPPHTLYGSIAGGDDVPDGTKVEAYIGDVECSDGNGITGHTGIGDSRVAIYVVHVVSASQKEGCGDAGDPVRVKIGDDFADQTATWEGGEPENLNIAFGDVPTVVLPTNTPVPPTNTPSADEATATAISEQTQQPTGEPGTPTKTPQGGLTGSDDAEGGSGTDDDSGGFPVWGIVVIGLAVLGAAGGGVGYLISRNNAGDELEDF